MMLPNRNPSVPPVPAIAPMPPDLVLSANDDYGTPPHTDYDLHPLRVDSLDHYAVLDDQKERFSVR